MHFRFIVIEFLFKNLARRYMLINDKFFSQLLINHRLTPFMQNIKAIESVLYCRSNDKNHSSFNTNWEECNQIKEHTAEDSHLAYFDRAAAPLRPMGHRAILKSNIHLRSSTSFKISQEVRENNDRRNNINSTVLLYSLEKVQKFAGQNGQAKHSTLSILLKLSFHQNCDTCRMSGLERGSKCQKILTFFCSPSFALSHSFPTYSSAFLFSLLSSSANAQIAFGFRLKNNG